MAPAWIINQTDNTFVSYVSATNGYTDLGTGVGQVPYTLVASTGTPATTNTTVLDISGSISMATQSVYALRINGNFNITSSGTTPTVTLGNATSGGGILAAGATSGVISPILKFGTNGDQEAIIYSSGVNLGIAGGLQTSGGATFFGAGGINLTGPSGGQGVFGGAAAGVVFSGNVYINTTPNAAYTAGNVFLSSQFALGGRVNLNAANPLINGSTITLNRGDLSVNLTNTYFPNDVVIAGDAAVGENGTTGTALNNLTFNSLGDGISGDPDHYRVVGHRSDGLLHDHIFREPHAQWSGDHQYRDQQTTRTIPVVIQGGITSGSSTLTKYGTQTLTIVGDSSTYTGNVTVNQGILATLDGSTGASSGNPFGKSNVITVNPGGELRIASAQNIASQTSVTINSDGAGLGAFGMAYVGAVPTTITFNANGGPVAGTLGIDVTGFSTALDETTLSTGRAGGKIVYLGSTQGGTYTAATLGAGANNTFYLGTGGSTLQINSSVLIDANPEYAHYGSIPASVQYTAVSNGIAGNSISLTNSSGNVFINTPQTYTGGTTVNGSNVQATIIMPSAPGRSPSTAASSTRTPLADGQPAS